MPTIFLSHNHADKLFVRTLANRLSLFGVNPWVDEAEINVGESLLGRVENAMRSSDYIGVVLSQKSICSDWVELELRAAIALELEVRQKKVIPIVTEPCEMPLFLVDRLSADFSTDYYIGFTALIRCLLKDDEAIRSVMTSDVSDWIRKHDYRERTDQFIEFIRLQAKQREERKRLDLLKDSLLELSINERVTAIRKACDSGEIIDFAEAFNVSVKCDWCYKPMVNGEEVVDAIIEGLDGNTLVDEMKSLVGDSLRKMGVSRRYRAGNFVRGVNWVCGGRCSEFTYPPLS